MPNENEKLVESQQENVQDGVDYIEAIKEMKQNTVSRESYEKLKEENRKLLNAYVNGEKIEMPAETAKPSIQELRKELYGSEIPMDNLKYIEKTLQLRDAIMEAGERDPFLPYGDKVSLTADHFEKAAGVAKVLKECVEFADGDSGIFTAELQRRTKDTPRFGRR